MGQYISAAGEFLGVGFQTHVRRQFSVGGPRFVVARRGRDGARPSGD